MPGSVLDVPIRPPSPFAVIRSKSKEAFLTLLRSPSRNRGMPHLKLPPVDPIEQIYRRTQEGKYLRESTFLRNLPELTVTFAWKSVSYQNPYHEDLSNLLSRLIEKIADFEDVSEICYLHDLKKIVSTERFMTSLFSLFEYESNNRNINLQDLLEKVNLLVKTVFARHNFLHLNRSPKGPLRNLEYYFAQYQAQRLSDNYYWVQSCYRQRGSINVSFKFTHFSSDGCELVEFEEERITPVDLLQMLPFSCKQMNWKKFYLMDSSHTTLKEELDSLNASFPPPLAFPSEKMSIKLENAIVNPSFFRSFFQLHAVAREAENDDLNEMILSIDLLVKQVFYTHNLLFILDPNRITDQVSYALCKQLSSEYTWIRRTVFPEKNNLSHEGYKSIILEAIIFGVNKIFTKALKVYLEPVIKICDYGDHILLGQKKHPHLVTVEKMYGLSQAPWVNQLSCITDNDIKPGDFILASIMDLITDEEERTYTLLELVNENEEIPLEAIQKIAIRLVKTLESLHADQVMFRDLKLENILIDKSGKTYLIDTEHVRKITKSGGPYRCAGSPLYRAPEMFKSRYYSEKVDLFALGVVLYMLTEKTPPYGPDFIDNEQISPPEFERTTDPDLKDLIVELLKKVPSYRPSAKAVRNYPFLLKEIPPDPI